MAAKAGCKRKTRDETSLDSQARKPGLKPDQDTNDDAMQPHVLGMSTQKTPDKEKDGDYDGEKKDKATHATREEAVSYKVFNDSIHGHIEIHALCVEIIDTPQFQRLRDIKQLGGCYFVFPGASHNRFEHSIGTCYLAGQLVEGLRHNQPQLDITDKDVLCVKIAGLCHDLGHGPFSHMFDALFIPLARNDGTKWKHEKGSLDMFEHMMKDDKLSKRFSDYDLNDTDVSFIKELITGKPLEETTLEHEDASLKMFVQIIEDKERPPWFKECKLTKDDERLIKQLITGKRQEETTSKHEDASLKLFELKQEKNEMLARFREYKLTEEDELSIKQLINGKLQQETTSEHEDPSLKTFVLMMEENTVSSRLRKNELTKEDEAFIKELFAGKPLEETTWKGWLFKGRGIEKCFLYEIVANKQTGIDVDKFDYFARDCRGLGIESSFDHKRYMKFAKVLKVDGVTQICVRDKEANNIYDMFHTRSSLHRRAYQHKTSNGIEIMITDALLKADEKVLFEGDKSVNPRKELPISKCIDDMEAYTQLSDNVYYQILNSSDPGLEEARDILRRIQNRDLYRCIGQTIVKPRENVKISGEKSVAESVRQSVEENLKNYTDDEDPQLDPKDFEIDVVRFDYGMGAENPMDKVRFYSKNEPDEAFLLPKDRVSYMLPDKFQEHHIRVYFRKNDIELRERADRWFTKWLENYTKEGEDAQLEQTPLTSSQEVGLNASQEVGFNASQEVGPNARRNLFGKA